jgi:rhodanese-related sulfurtransferase/DNA-binding transcriptional ArsR family regulator
MRKIDHRRFKDDLYGGLARISGALASPKRLEMLELLAQRERTVEDLAAEMGLSVANASKHLRALAAANLVEVRRERNFAHYRIAGPTVLRLLRLIGNLAEERLADVPRTLERYLGERSVRDIAPASVARRVKSGRAILLDVRPEPEYRAGHIPGARNVPIESLASKKLVEGLRRDREIIVYCRGPYCVWADEAVEQLHKLGFTAHRLLLGAPDWSALGEGLEVAG